MKTLNTTPTEFKLKEEARLALSREKSKAENEENWDLYFSNKKLLEKLDEEYFSLLPRVSCSFYIGHRKYYRSLIKINASYYEHGEKMTKGNGYRNITEIPEITEKMQDEMIADSYYY